MVLVIKMPKPLSESQPKPDVWVATEDSAATSEETAKKKTTMLINRLAIRDVTLWKQILNKKENVNRSPFPSFLYRDGRNALEKTS